MPLTAVAGAAKYGKPLGVDAKDLVVDLIIVGSVAVCPKTGARIGKGEGFAELEYGVCVARCSLLSPPSRRSRAKLRRAGMLRLMGAVTEKTLVVTSVSDSQVCTGCNCCSPAVCF